MFSGIGKILFLTAPVIAIILFVVWIKMSAHEAKMDVESAKFDKDFAVMQESLSNTKSEKKHWETKSKEADQQIEAAKKLNEVATGEEKALKDDFANAAKEFGKKGTK